MSVHTLNGNFGCHEVGALYREFINETLEPEVHQKVQQHILTCEKCSVSLADAVFEAMTAQELPPVEVPPLPRPGRPRLGARPA